MYQLEMLGLFIAVDLEHADEGKEKSLDFLHSSGLFQLDWSCVE